MDYEKAYNEALERAKKVLLDCTSEERKAIEYAFPKLRESEDEKIIDDAIQIIRASRLRCAEYGSDADKHLKAIAYLEKQKESLHISETCKENADSFTDEDEKIREFLYEFINICAWSEKQYPPRKKCLTYLEKQKDASKEYWRGYREGKQEILDKYAEIKRQKEQKTEPFSCGHENGSSEKPNNQWSEEDEKQIRQIERRVKNGATPKLQEKIHNFLYSLRPQPHWKPSEEQMKSLLQAEGHLRRYECREIARDIAELYNDLKKLM